RQRASSGQQVARRRALSRDRYAGQDRARALSRCRSRRRQGRARIPVFAPVGRALSQGAVAQMTNFKLDIDGEGIALISWDAPGRAMNVIDLKVIEELSSLVDKVASDATIKGAVVTSRKDAFCAGADLTMLGVFSRKFAEITKVQGEGAGASL